MVALFAGRTLSGVDTTMAPRQIRSRLDSSVAALVRTTCNLCEVAATQFQDVQSAFAGGSAGHHLLLKMLYVIVERCWQGVLSNRVLMVRLRMQDPALVNINRISQQYRTTYHFRFKKGVVTGLDTYD